MSVKDPGENRQFSQEDDTKKDNSRIYGNECKKKEKKNVRIMFQNINGFGYSQSNPKSSEVRNLIYQKDVDIMALAELNVKWSKLRREQTLPQLCKRWFQTSKATMAYNQHERRQKYKHQPGGTAIVTKGEMALRTGKWENDSRRLGRWSSILIHGKQSITTRIVSVYVPNMTSKHGHKKVVCQQQRALLSLGIKENVFTVFWTDFWETVDKWIANGEQLIIAGDWNTNVTKEKFLEEFAKRELIPVMSTSHGKDLPETHNNGSYPIDEIFISKTLDVQAAGYLEHGATTSDHRALWVDISKITMLGSKASLKPTYSARKLKTNDPRVVQKYLQKLHLLLDQQKVLQRAERLHRWTNGPLTEEQIEEFEELDLIKNNAMDIAEKGCRKLKMGEIKWCPKIQMARDKIRYFTLSRRKLLGRKVSSSLLQRLSKKTSCVAMHLDIYQLGEQIDRSYKQYKVLKKQHDKLRESFLDELAEAWASKGKGKKATIVKNLLAIESQRATFRKIAAINQKTQDLSTKFVSVTSSKGTRIISEKRAMETAIINENKDKYHQTEETCPFMDDPLLTHFGEMGLGEYTELVLKGEYTPPDAESEQTKTFLKLCKVPSDELIINPMTRSLDYFSNSWKAMKERTASRTVHFGHFRAAVESDEIMRCHYALAEIPFRSGYSPKRWQKANNVMILKKEGVNDLSRLRTLVLFEAEFNHNNKFLGRNMMQHMKQTHSLAEEQYSAPGKKSIDQVLNRKLFFDLTRYQKTSAAMAAADLKSCYDRVAHVPAYLAMRSYGMSSEPIQSMFTTIQDMQ